MFMERNRDGVDIISVWEPDPPIWSKMRIMASGRKRWLEVEGVTGFRQISMDQGAYQLAARIEALAEEKEGGSFPSRPSQDSKHIRPVK